MRIRTRGEQGEEERKKDFFLPTFKKGLHIDTP